MAFDSSPGTNGARRADRRERKRAEERLRILGAAARVFQERGFSGAGMREIADAADLSAANLYHYFRSKDEILFFCQDRTLDRLMESLAAARKARGPVAERLRALARIHVLGLIEGVEGAAAHFEVDPTTPGLREAIAAKREAYKRGIRGLIALGIRRGEFRRCNATLAMRGFLGALNWTPHWYRSAVRHPPEQVAQHLAAYAVAGLTAGAG